MAQLPYGKPFLFVDELLEVTENGTVGTYTYHKELDFYKGHFKDFPVTPGVILTETMAQIGLACLGIYLMGTGKLSIAMTATAIDFIKPVLPEQKVTVTSKKVYFRFNKLKCEVEMKNDNHEIVCKGTIAGMITQNPNV